MIIILKITFYSSLLANIVKACRISQTEDSSKPLASIPSLKLLGTAVFTVWLWSVANCSPVESLGSVNDRVMCVVPEIGHATQSHTRHSLSLRLSEGARCFLFLFACMTMCLHVFPHPVCYLHQRLISPYPHWSWQDHDPENPFRFQPPIHSLCLSVPVSLFISWVRPFLFKGGK